MHKKFSNYSELRHCLAREKAALIDLNMDSLWAISREKEEICGEIEKNRSELFSVLSRSFNHEFTQLSHTLDFLPNDVRPQFQQMYRRISRIKGEIEAMRKENMIYINDSLRFLDQMISIFTGETQAKPLYTDQCQFRKTSHSLMLNREV